MKLTKFLQGLDGLNLQLLERVGLCHISFRILMLVDEMRRDSDYAERESFCNVISTGNGYFTKLKKAAFGFLSKFNDPK